MKPHIYWARSLQLWVCFSVRHDWLEPWGTGYTPAEAFKKCQEVLSRSMRVGCGKIEEVRK